MNTTTSSYIFQFPLCLAGEDFFPSLPLTVLLGLVIGDHSALKLARGGLAVKENVELTVVPALAFGQEEPCSDGDEDGHASPKESNLASPC